MDFEKSKKAVLDELGNPDKSRAGGPDPQIVSLLDAINTLPGYYTTSSCAGRIMLIELKGAKKKHESVWHMVSHELVDAQEVVKLYTDTDFSDETWFKMEAIILHVCCKDLESAQHMLSAAQACGFKHSGIIGTTKRIMLEIIDQQRIEALVAADSQKLASEQHISYLCTYANQKLAQARDRMHTFEETIKKEF